MKRLLSFAMGFTLLAVTFVLPVYAAEAPAEYETDVVYVENLGLLEIQTATTVWNISSLTKSVEQTKTYTKNGSTIATVTLNATFGYDGSTAWVESSSASHTTYNGWAYSGESITPSGSSVSLNATLSKFPYSSIPVDISLICSSTGNIS